MTEHILKKITLLSILFLLIVNIPAYADMGRIVAYGAKVQENSQKAIIFYNLNEEVLILGTDLQSGSSSHILRFIPFPSKPRVQLAPKDSFKNIIKVVKKHNLQFIIQYKGVTPTTKSVEIKLNKKIGAHDLTVIKINSTEHLREWINDFFKSKGLPVKNSYPEVEMVVNSYLNKGINYFAFDLVKVNKKQRFVQPIEYRFHSKKLYYPLITSNTFGGSGIIDLILISPRTVCNPLESLYEGCLGVKYLRATTSDSITIDEFNRILPDAKNFFKNKSIFIQMLSYGGSYKFKNDIFVDITNKYKKAIGYTSNNDSSVYHSFPWEDAVGNKPPVKKPAIYLYPKTKLNINILLNIDGKITKTVPPYSHIWKITAYPSGNISGGYDYLMYEAQLNSLTLPKSGWVVEYQNLKKWFDTYLFKIGLNKKEKLQFEEYWLKELPKAKYYEIKLLSGDFLNKHMNIEIKPKPDTFLRFIFYFKPLSKKIILSEQKIVTPKRVGFTAVEWGGILDKRKNKRCFLYYDRGPCEALFWRYYYNKQENICKPFIWGGCGGSVPFKTKEECSKACISKLLVKGGN
ncbi:BPTI/Kunitz domain-containing protein [Hippea maritima]|uniref:Proteinase inhibitor I2 Kunitz metazoa n=1 Tax=Hippea maritima (strain ATCC 700847 / DSM 10411 / MH2) TaxID=760142 RepID=F2LTX4_HIPMA|nr:BPTI/Kunitz domain-containing protein [Hippea maritima]AEA33373.1 proteinase inhibitor I2 Kunitz metazoa [Hippea maritima DSM 10411]